MAGRSPPSAADEIQRMQGGVRAWVEQAARRGQGGLRSASPTVLLSLLCASAFCPLLMATGVAGAGLSVLSGVGGGFLTQLVSDVLSRLREHDDGHPPSQPEVEKEIARQIQQALAAADWRANALRGEIASVLQEIDAGGTALRAVMEQGNEQVRNDVIAAIGVLGSDFSEMRFLLRDVAQAAADMQKSLDEQGADIRAIREQNARQSTDIRLVREDLAVIAGRAGEARSDGDGARWERGCPYRGLLPFSESDSAVFYGRERLTAELAVKLAARVSRGGLVVVTGASGAGKSSLLRAGLVPVLARGQQIEGSERWPCIVMTPTKDPFAELAARLAAVGGLDTLAVREGLARHPDQAHLAIWSAVLAGAARRGGESPAADGSGERLVLIVDQFEQLFTLSSGPEGEAVRQAFVTVLCSAATNPVGPGLEPPALVMIAVRGDFWHRCAALPKLAGALQDGQFVVGPMTESELRVAITAPADIAGLRIDPALTDTILGDLRVAGRDGSAGVLPLLSQAMALTWERREGDRLTSHGYARAGGVSHAVQTGAERAYRALPAGQQALARDVLRSMTVAGRDSTLARRPVTRDDLYAWLPGAVRADVDAVLDGFAAERLAVLDGDTAQLSHDVLLLAWPRLRRWLEQDQASWIFHGQLADAAAAWHGSGGDSSFLYRGSQLAALQQAVTRWSADPGRYPALTSVQRDFLGASERAATRSSRRRRSSFAVLAVLTALAVAASGLAFFQRTAAIHQRDQAIYNQVIAEALQASTSDPSLAAQLTLAAYRIRPSQDLVSHLLNTENIPLSSSLVVGSGGVLSVAFSLHAHILASGNNDGTIRLWDLTDRAHPRPLGQPLNSTTRSAVNTMAFSPDGRTLATGDFGDSVQLWDLTDPSHPRPLSQPQVGQPQADRGSTPSPVVSSVAFSAARHILASGEADGMIRLWDVANPAHPRPLSQVGQRHILGIVLSSNPVAFSPDGRILASGSPDGTIRLWDLTDPAHPQPLGQLGQPQAGKLQGGSFASSGVDSVAFSPYGHTLASGSFDGTTQLWDLTNPARPRPLGQAQTGNGGPVDSVAFSPDAHTLASGNNDGTTNLWDITDPAHPRALGQRLTGTGNAVYSVAYSPDGRTLATGDSGGTIELWNLPQTVLTGSDRLVTSVAFSPGGQTLASGSFKGTIRLWDLTDPAHPRPLGQPLTGTGNPVDSVAYSPDGRTLATADFGGSVRLWDLTDPAHPGPLGQPLTGAGTPVESVAYSPDGRTLASCDINGTIRLWDLTDPAHPRRLTQLTPPDSSIPAEVAFDPRGHTLASGTYDGTIKLWDLAVPGHPRPLGQLGQPHSGSATAVASVAFSPDGHTLASGTYDGTTRLWNIADITHPRPIAQLRTNGSAPIVSVVFSPHGRTLASGSNGTIRLWDLANPVHPRPLGQPLTGAGSGGGGSVAYSPDGHTLAGVSNDNAIWLWNLNVRYAIERICATTNALTPQQWNQYIPQLQYKPPCAH